MTINIVSIVVGVVVVVVVVVIIIIISPQTANEDRIGMLDDRYLFNYACNTVYLCQQGGETTTTPNLTRMVMQNSCRGDRSRRQHDTQVASVADRVDCRSPHRRRHGRSSSGPRSRETWPEIGHRSRPLNSQPTRYWV